MSLDDACSRLAALSDPLRLRMMALMHREGELCVCELTHALAVPQPKASKHLAILREAGLARMRRHAQWALCSFAPDADRWPRRSRRRRCNWTPILSSSRTGAA